MSVISQLHVVTNPIALISLAIGLVFAFSVRKTASSMPDWWPAGGYALAVLISVGGFGLAFLDAKNSVDVKAASQVASSVAAGASSPATGAASGSGQSIKLGSIEGSDAGLQQSASSPEKNQHIEAENISNSKLRIEQK